MFEQLEHVLYTFFSTLLIAVENFESRSEITAFERIVKGKLVLVELFNIRGQKKAPLTIQRFQITEIDFLRTLFAQVWFLIGVAFEKLDHIHTGNRLIECWFEWGERLGKVLGTI